MIDISFDFRSDTPPGRDPDAFSPTLRRYHQLLWSKPLPSGAPFVLDVATAPYLHHVSELGEFWLSSDAFDRKLLERQQSVLVESFAAHLKTVPLPAPPR